MKLTRRLPSAKDRIFINYRRDDSVGYAGRLADSLGAWFGPERIFRDVSGIDYGADFEQAIDNRLEESGAVVVVIGGGGPTFTLAGPLPVPMPDLEPPPYGLAKQPNNPWDQIQVIYDANIVRPELNFTNEMGPAITEDMAGYGVVALFVGGTSTVHFKDVSFKDIPTGR